MSDRSRSEAAATGALFVVGLVALGAAAWQGCSTAAFLGRAARATGEITTSSPRPVIRFVSDGGTTTEFRQGGFISRPSGAAVPIAYEPHDPAGTARAATFWALWGDVIFLLPMGLGFTLLPLLGARAEFRLRRW